MADRTAGARFGPWWTASVLSVIAGAFLFLGFHAVFPNWKRKPVVLTFIVTLALVAGAGAFGFSG
jgi:zinc transporter ZupT